MGDTYTVWIGNLSYYTRTRDLEDVFSECGRIYRIFNPGKGYAFVEFERSADASYSVETLDGTMLDGRRINVEHAKNRSYSSGDDRSKSRKRAHNESESESDSASDSERAKKRQRRSYSRSPSPEKVKVARRRRRERSYSRTPSPSLSPKAEESVVEEIIKTVQQNTESESVENNEAKNEIGAPTALV
eukprot:TRINITY_DN68_c0_g1_i2.p1 TRINITY_DN68_c0_g1~~TRINITY_DN68_c0_g1_i2.p1  ORF type:complete len:188 (+),score=46.48 TRINITY_DN68_c0_g1_i2:138-701(+)